LVGKTLLAGIRQSAKRFSSPDNMELIGSVFRAMHTIKGSGAMFGFDDIANFTHEVETVYDLVRDGAVSVTKPMVDLSLEACDLIRKMVDGKNVDANRMAEVVAAFKKMVPQTDAVEGFEPEAPQDMVPQDLITYRIRFRPEQDIFATGTNPLLLLEELKALGESKVVSQTGQVPSLSGLKPESCYLYWDIILTTGQGINAIRDVFIFVEDACEVTIDTIDESGDMASEEDYKRLGEILVERGDVSADDLRDVLKSQKRVGEMLVDAKVVDKAALASALAEQQHVKQIRQGRRETTMASSIRVAADKLDTLVDLVGEMVTVQARLTQNASSAADSSLIAIAEEVERLTAELRDNTMSIRMVPIGMTFSRFKRLVRDLSRELGKKIAMTTEGGETELDKTVIDRLNDPLVHIIRNCIDHGIEPPDVRERNGKVAQGSVRLSAIHSGANVLIRITDDGAGLDTDAIRARAVERGVIATDADLSDSDIFSLIFAPGFSTAKEVTDVSGRGVGMDVVKRSIESLRGSIEVESSKGKGTTITLKLPLTLAIIDGFMVKVGGGHFVLPLSAVEECVEIQGQEAETVRARSMMNVRGDIVPYQSLRDLFNINGGRPEIEKVVITEANGSRVGFGVDLVIGQHQTVIKSLGKAYRDTEGLSGATIMGDGTVALIIDVNNLVKTVENDTA